MYFRFTAEQKDFETHITDQTLLSVMAVRMWSCLTLIVTKSKSLTVPLNILSIYFLLLRCPFLSSKPGVIFIMLAVLQLYCQMYSFFIRI